MGCINSKNATSVVAASPVPNRSKSSGLVRGFSTKDSSSHANSKSFQHRDDDFTSRDSHTHSQAHTQRSGSRRFGKSKKGTSNNGRSGVSLKLALSHGNVAAEQIAAGWPAWLSAAASEAVHGWVPLRADAFEKLEKIGQGTYSSVFRAREVETGKMVALKKVRFDNFQPESIRFMAREILILRRLDHPNIMKLEGLITSRLSNSIYLVFEYMEHDLAGLSSCPDIRFTESQVKCYMKQLLWGLEHCHLRGVVHRDIKASNILVNNQGILKLGDFGLANIVTPRNKSQLTSRVVTLWYRAPELLMGSTNYGVSIDLWSVGCVFAEILLGKPILKGRTEIEQLHKIYKLCGSPHEDYWNKSKLPHVTMFKPQHPYESTLRERCKEFPTSAVNLLETFLSIEPEKRGTASSALISEYFNTRPYACDPSSMPKYPPNKEIDAKHREELRRKKAGVKMRDSGPSKKSRKARKLAQESKNFGKLASNEEMQENTGVSHRNNGGNAPIHKGRDSEISRGALNTLMSDTMSETTQGTASTQGDYLYTGLSQTTAPSGFTWGKKRKDDAISTLTYNQPSSMSKISASSMIFANNTFRLTSKETDNTLHRTHTENLGRELYKITTGSTLMRQNLFDEQDSLPASSLYFSQKEISPTNHLDYKNKTTSGPLLSEAHRIDQILQKNETNIRRAARRP